jgi:protein involved in polysaccharide export with SLBB domain
LARNSSVLLALVLLVPVVGGCPASLPVAPHVAVEDDTTLGPGDVIEIRVFNEKEISGNYQVARDGTIAFPFLGVVAVGGKDTHVVAEALAKGLKDGGYMVNPYVSLRLEESNSKKLSVLGAVARPGTLPLTPGMTVVQAISQAGGFSPLASKDETVVSRRVGEKIERYRIAVTEIVRGAAQDFALRSGDLIFVPERVF